MNTGKSNLFMKLRTKRKAGIVDGILLSVICILIITAMLVILTDVLILLNYSNNIDQLTRKYILLLETEGTVNKQEIENKINDMGYSTYTVIVNNGATAPVEFGETVTLQITVEATPQELDLFGSNLLQESKYVCKKMRESISKAR